MKESLFLSNKNIINPPKSNNLNDAEINQNIKVNNSLAVTNHKYAIPENKILAMQAPEIHHSEETLTRYHRRLLSQLRTSHTSFYSTYTKLTLLNTHHHSAPFALTKHMTQYTSFNAYKYRQHLLQ